MKIENLLIGIFIFLFFFSSTIFMLYTDYLWFGEVDYVSIFLTILKTKFFLGLAGFLTFLIFGIINLRWAGKNLEKEGNAMGSQYVSFASLVVFFFALLLGIGLASKWDTVLMYMNQVGFQVADPIFNQDVGFYVFTLPFYKLLQGFLLSVTVIVALTVGAMYLISGGFFQRIYVEYQETEGPQEEFSRINIPQFNEDAITHLSILGGLIFILVSWGFYLSRYAILYSTRGVVEGAGYTDIHVQLPLMTLLAVFSLGVALLFFVNIKLHDLKWPGTAIFLLLIVSFGGSFFGSLIQSIQVTPDEFNMEKTYLGYSINYTRQAYDLHKIQQVEFPAIYNLSYNQIMQNNQTIDNIRLWDWRPLLSTYSQIQLIRTYYDFTDVDIDRYNINGRYSQVMLSPRELDINQLPKNAQNWVSQHMLFTHGYGLTMSPVRTVSAEGLPELYIKDIPPKSDYFNVTRPGIYFGEATDNYIFVKTTNNEFDYPSGTTFTETVYSGTAGIEMSSMLRKIAMASRFVQINILLSNSIQPDSRIIFNRDIKTRAHNIAPFLIYDSDPYIVLNDQGQLFWMMDGYTVTDSFPYSEASGRINYIRNPVKVTIDAYNGETTFYIIDDTDPLIQVYQKVFPELFRPFSEMPSDLQAHIRYPEDLFSILAAKYGSYHMLDPQVFYQKEDLWVTPNEIYEGSKVLMEPYYLIAKLPGSEKEEFLLLMPFTPRNKDNMIASMAAKADMPNYGEIVVYSYPKDKLIYGPMQIEARIDQDTEISQDFTLWSQAGTRVIRGNLLAIPIEDSILYVEPVYLRAQQEGSIPELKRVIVAFGNKLAMEETLEEALMVVFKGEEIRPERPADGIDEDTMGLTEKELIEKAVQHYDLAQEYLKEGDWTGYGSELGKMKTALDELNSRTNN